MPTYGFQDLICFIYCSLAAPRLGASISKLIGEASKLKELRSAKCRMAKKTSELKSSEKDTRLPKKPSLSNDYYFQSNCTTAY